MEGVLIGLLLFFNWRLTLELELLDFRASLGKLLSGGEGSFRLGD
jgi:hypothetical protein